jgi:hypothetical protein
MRIPSFVRDVAKRVLPEPRRITCIACGQPRSASRALISGPEFYACAECVTPELPAVAPHDSLDSADRCDWCRAPRLRSDLRTLGPTAICLSCLIHVRSVFRDNAERLVT